MRSRYCPAFLVFLALVPGLALPGSISPAQAAPAPAGRAETQQPAPAETGPPRLDRQAGSWLRTVDFRGLWGRGPMAVSMAWIVPIGAILLGLLAGRISSAVLRFLARRCEARGWAIRQQVFAGLASPANVALFTVGLAVAVANVEALDASRGFWEKTILLLFSIAVLWYASNLVATIELVLRRLPKRAESSVDRSLGPLARKTLRVILWTIGGLWIANSVFEQNIAALLAGLGIAGLAVSLAAQDSLKNLFGSVTIMLDRPFQVGERILYKDYDGVVEEIGLRSTKLRTLSGNLVTIPNSNIVNDPVENVARRPSIRRIINVAIPYDTRLEKIRQAVAILRGILEEEGIRERIHPVIGGDEYPPRVFFSEYNAASLNLFVIYWYAPPVWWDYMEHAERLNFRIFEEFEKAAIEFAFPTQTVYLAGDAKRRLAIEMLGKGMGEGMEQSQ